MRLNLFHKPSQPRYSPFFSAERRKCLIINYRRSVSYWQDKIMSLFQSLSSSNCGSVSGYIHTFAYFASTEEHSILCWHCLKTRMIPTTSNRYPIRVFSQSQHIHPDQILPDASYTSWDGKCYVTMPKVWRVLIFSVISCDTLSRLVITQMCAAAWSQDIEIDQVCIRIHCNLLITVVEG